MKRILFFVATLITLQTNAKIWRVNNNPNLKADALQVSTLFNNTNNALDPEANAGDTIYVEPSNVQYNGFTIDEPNIKIFGNGYFLNEYAALTTPEILQQNLNKSEFGTITMGLGSAGSSLYGLVINNVYCADNNDTLSRCNVFGLFIYGSGATSNKTGIRIEKSYITGFLTDQVIPTGLTYEIAIENCIFAQAGGYSNNFSNKVKGIFRNNVCNETSSFYTYNFYIANNIFVGNVNCGNNSTNSGNNIFRNNFFSYNSNAANTSAANTQPGNSANVFGVNMANIFVGTPDNTSNGTSIFNNRINITAGVNVGDSRFELKAGSLALAAGEGGITVGGATVITPNLGAFGATDPYRKAGIPAIPSIEILSVPSSIPSTATNIVVTIKSKSNN
jgi:hypothetical protein